MSTCGSCLTAPLPFDAAIAAVDYAFPWDGLVLQLKFHGALDLAESLAAALHAAVQRGPAGATALPELLLPVPLSRVRLRDRGYNQAWEIARRLGRRLQIPARTDVLLRIQEGPHQLELPVERRAANVKSAFALHPRRRGAVHGRHVALVDDVATTGATAAALTRVLKHAGAASVALWCVARTPQPGDNPAHHVQDRPGPS